MSQYAGLDLLATGTVVLDRHGAVRHLNGAAQQLLGLSPRVALGQSFARLFVDGAAIDALVEEVDRHQFGQKRFGHVFERPGHEPVRLQVAAVALDDGGLLLELTEHDEREREARLLDTSQATRELLRNLAHEVKNPLGGIRGAAQLLECELADPALHDYTRVIVKEADRLQTLVDRLLAPHRQARHVDDVNIHEVCERVRAVTMAEFPRGLEVVRDYDASLPEFRGDKEQLIQAVLNLVRNAAQALHGAGTITLRTRVARQVTIGRQRWKLALDLHVVDDGPGVPEAIRERIFFPLVTGREGGSGLGLSIAQTFVQQHGGVIDCDSRPGHTDFRIRLPLP